MALSCSVRVDCLHQESKTKKAGVEAVVEACKTVLWRHFCVRSVPPRRRTLGREKIGMKFGVSLRVLTRVDYLIKAG